ncbi:hypothetical protein DL239_04700 [Sedimentitalea sp. CY04]|uniref:Cysteine-rich CPCC domain-containing protein n=1 Tax=Parasedimentitalea denitrificans TaxID=2211118 RepID=A0ABX0W7I3_9RHOB|nr:CPCC family cysteine-rich protein [Sedimentitalea sp. CY04]NIZ60270.1 hypothetical protein [Sedimentitalea sp. CY04]
MKRSQCCYCPCRGALGAFEEVGHHEICNVCGWQDDPIQREQPDYEGGANDLSLNQASTNYLNHGCSDPVHSHRQTNQSE